MDKINVLQLWTLFYCEPFNDDLLVTPTQLASVPDVCEHVCAFSFPHSKWTLAWWDVFSQSEASPMNGLWPAEVSSVDLGVTWTQWWTELLKEEQKQRPPGSKPIVVGGAKTWEAIKKKRGAASVLKYHIYDKQVFFLFSFFYCFWTSNRNIQLQQYLVAFLLTSLHII